ncbi:MAG: glycosyltransferase family 39 protein [Anaerolineales bacterium]|jgi:hypothetical protein
MKKILLDRKIFQNIVIFILLAGVILLPRLPRLGYYATADEHQYLKHSGSFYYLLTEKDFSHTDLIIHPGVLSLWSGAIGFFLKFPDFTEYTQYPLSDLLFFKITAGHETTLEQLLAQGRAVSLAFQVGLLLLSTFYLMRVFGRWPAILGILFVAFDPFYFANSRILQPDGILSTCVFLSVTAYVSYRHSKRRGDIIVSGIAAGLSLLSKTTGIVLVLFVVLFETANWFYQRRQAKPPKISIKSSGANILMWGAAAIVIFVALWPAMWVKPVEVISEMVQSTFALSGEVNSPVFFNGHINPEGEFGLSYWYFYLVTWLWRTTPLVVFGLILGLIPLVWKQTRREQASWRSSILALLSFVVIFFIVMSISKKKFDRYLLPAHTIIDLLAGLGWIGFLTWLRNWIPEKIKALIPTATVLVVAGQLWMTASVYPYYHSYYNPLLGGALKAQEVMMVGWGEGLDQAARYLSKQPRANKLVIYSWYANTLKINYVYWSKFDTLPRGLPISGPISDEEFGEMLQADYIVTYICQWQRNSSGRILEYLADKSIEHTVTINGIEYAYIYNMKAIQGSE